MSKQHIKRGDTAFLFQDRLVDKAGNAIDLTGATVVFIIKGVESGTKFRRAATVLAPVDVTDPNVQYAPVVQDTDTAGEFLLEWEVTFANNKVLTFPQKGYNKLTIEKDLDA